MQLYVVNLQRARERRIRMEQQLATLGLAATFHPAIDGRELTSEHYAEVDRNARRRLGLYPQADGSIANWLSQRQVLRHVVEHGPELVAIFEDDAGLSPDLPSVLTALEQRPFAFDVVKLSRRSATKPFIPCERLPSGHQVGRIRYADYGNEGYVLTRHAARHFLTHQPKMIREIDQAIPRFWESGLNVFYVDPPVVSHSDQDDSQIESDRRRSRLAQKKAENRTYILWRRLVSGATRELNRRLAFRRMMRGEISVTPWPSGSGSTTPETADNGNYGSTGRI